MSTRQNLLLIAWWRLYVPLDTELATSQPIKKKLTSEYEMQSFVEKTHKFLSMEFTSKYETQPSVKKTIFWLRHAVLGKTSISE